jgi:predicted transcriptional regulator
VIEARLKVLLQSFDGRFSNRLVAVLVVDFEYGLERDWLEVAVLLRGLQRVVENDGSIGNLIRLRSRCRKPKWPRGQPPVDSVVDAPYAGFMNLQVPPELEAKLTRLAAETGRTADQVAIDLLASSVNHDEWFRGEVEKGRASAREGRLLDHEDVVARMDQRYRG